LYDLTLVTADERLIEAPGESVGEQMIGRRN
jgi:hypothetical protein